MSTVGYDVQTKYIFIAKASLVTKCPVHQLVYFGPKFVFYYAKVSHGFMNKFE